MNVTFNRSRLLGVGLALLTAACAQSNGDINRVQPNVVKKTELDGVWYFRNTVTWTPATTNFTYPGQTGMLEKLVFEIQENHLVGYRAYPYILGAENNIDASSKVTGTTAKYCDKNGACTGGQPYYGTPIVAFPIQSHFDIQRNYNPATGEQGNVITENASDRVWNQREYIRVDWSANVLNQGAGMNWGTVQNPAGGSSSSTWIQPNEKGESPEDWPTREYDSDGKLIYFDYTGRYLANPDTYYFEDWGYVPMCYLSRQNDCSSSEIRMRLSFARVNPARSRDYEPLLYDNDVMSKFGYFRVERLNYDRRFGYTNSAVLRLATRHRIWNEYYQKDSNGQPDLTKPIDLAARTPKPVVYYVTRADLMGGTENYQQYLQPAKAVEADWDRAFRRAVAAAQNKPVDQVAQAFVVCENPVPAGANAACGNEGFSPKFGDLRYSFINTIAEPVANGLLGYGPSSPDPETGEIISANSNTYLWGVDLSGRDVLNTIDFLLGAVTDKDFISGQVNRDYINSNPVYQVRDAYQKVTQGQAVQAELQGIETRNERSLGAFERLTARGLKLKETIKSQGGISKSTRDEMRAAADVLAQNPQLEAAVIDNPEVRQDMLDSLPPSVRARAEADPAFLRKATRRFLTDGRAIVEWNKQRDEWAGKNSVTFAEFFDRTLYGLAFREAQTRDNRIKALQSQGHPKCATAGACTAVEAKKIANDEIAVRASQAVWLATTLHEVGHTLGLRHNFQGSFDAVNYFDEYWNLRKTTLTVQQSGQSKLPRTPADLVSTAAGTDVQRANSMHDYEYSSIMDYAQKINGDWRGIGKYDEAAILFAYSGDSKPGYVEVFEGARKAKQDFPGSDGKVLTITGAGSDLPLVNAQHKHPGIRNYNERFHYTTVPLHFGEGANVDVVIADGLTKLKQRKLMRWADVKSENERVAKLLESDPTLIDDPDRATTSIGNAPLEVPYMFCTDDHVGGVLSCNPFDRGPDYYEMNRTKLEDYWNYYYMTHFRRDRLGFSANAALNSAYMAFDAAANVYKHWVFDAFSTNTSGQELRPRVKVDTQTQDYWTLAVIDGINNHLNVMAVPPAGLFMLRNMRYGPQWDVISEGDDYDSLDANGKAVVQDYYRSRFNAQAFAELPRGLGRRMYSRYDFRSGFGFFSRMIEAGHFNDQVGAMFAAVIPEFNILGADQIADQQRFNIPYYLVFKTELEKAFSAMWAKQEEYVRPTMFLTTDDAGKVTTKPSVIWKRFVLGQDIVNGFNYPPELDKACPNNNVPEPGCLIPAQRKGAANIQTTWTSRIYSLYLGMALFRVNYDLDYARQNQLYKLGGGEQQTVSAGYHLVEVDDVLTGSRYAAIEKNGAAPDSTPAVKMINIAKEMQEMVQNPAKCPLGPYLDYVGYTCMNPEDARNPSLVEDRRKYWSDIFQDQIRDLDLMRGMYQAYGKAF